MDANTDGPSSSMDKEVRHGLCCQKCLTTETAQLRLKVCSRCKAAHYCSAECQKEHWKEHKPVCDQRKEATATAKDRFEADFVKAQSKWGQQARPGLTHLVHSLLPQRKLHTHVVYVGTHYQPEATPQFKIVSYQAISLAELRDMNKQLYDAVTEHMKTTTPLIEGRSKGAGVVGYAVVLCDNAHESSGAARIIPLGLDAEAIKLRARPEDIVFAMNIEAFRNM